MKHFIFTISLIIITHLNAAALLVRTESAGSLASVAGDPAKITELTVVGKINAVDLVYMADNMPLLQTLDLAETEITAYTGDIIAGASTHRAGVIPAKVFAGKNISVIIFPRQGNIEIGEMAFAGTQIKNLSLGDNIVMIGMGAFCACNDLTEISFTGNSMMESDVFNSCDRLEKVALVNVSEIAPATFSNCTSLSEIAGAGSLKSIGDNSFASCTSLKNFEFGKELKSVGSRAFMSTALLTLDLAATEITAIGDWAFAHCVGLEKAALPVSVKVIGEGIFFDCTSLSEIALPEPLAEIGDFSLKGLKTVAYLALPSSLEHIGDMAMSGMSGLKNVDATSLKSVPALGDEVWDAIIQSAVTLTVDADVIDEFKTALQWQEFNIVSKASSIKPGLADVTTSTISGYCRNDVLYIKSDNAPLTSVIVYDLTGSAVSHVSAADTSVEIDVSGYSDGLMIVEARTNDGVRGVIKVKL